MKKAIHTDKAPKAIGPYSQAIKAGNLLFVSGQIPLEPKSMELVSGDAAKQAHQCLTNIKAILEEEGLGMGNVVKVQIFLKNMDDFVSVNEVYGKFFDAPYPARATVQVAKLPKDVGVEIDAIAVYS